MDECDFVLCTLWEENVPCSESSTNCWDKGEIDLMEIVILSQPSQTAYMHRIIPVV